MWWHREIENYFLDPQYLARSKYCMKNETELEEKIVQFADKRLFLDVANNVVISIREELKKNWIVNFSSPGDFKTKNDALAKLKNAKEFGEHSADVRNRVSTDELERRFEDFLHKMTDGQERLSFGVGKWLELIKGKKVLAQVVNSECFKVETGDKQHLNGKAKLNAVVKICCRMTKSFSRKTLEG